MKIRYYTMQVMVSAAALGFAATCRAAPVSEFFPSPDSSGVQATAKASAGDIQIFTNAPSEDVVILGELSVNGGSGASLHELMVAALGEAMGKGADFVALYSPTSQPSLWIGKMVPSGHGRSMFVAGPVLGSEVGRIAAIPPGSPGSLRLILGRYAKRSA